VYIVLLVIFTVIMLVWLLLLLGVLPGTSTAAHGWLAWVACLVLGIIVFLTGTGALVWRVP